MPSSGVPQMRQASRTHLLVEHCPCEVQHVLLVPLSLPSKLVLSLTVQTFKLLCLAPKSAYRREPNIVWLHVLEPIHELSQLVLVRASTNQVQLPRTLPKTSVMCAKDGERSSDVCSTSVLLLTLQIPFGFYFAFSLFFVSRIYIFFHCQH